MKPFLFGLYSALAFTTLAASSQNWRGSSYSSWASLMLFAHSGYDASPYGDPDRDGAMNYVEFARGTNPTTADRPNLEHLSPSRNQSDDGSVFKFQFVPSLSDVSWTYEISTDLFSWSNAQPSASAATATVGDLHEVSVIVPDSVPAEPAKFGRLRWNWSGGTVGDSLLTYAFTSTSSAPTTQGSNLVTGENYDLSNIGSFQPVPTAPVTRAIGSRGQSNTNDTASVPVTTWIRDDAPNDDKEDYQIFVGSLAGGGNLRGLLSFDLSSIPDNATITAANISLYQSGNTTGNNDNEPSQNVDLQLFSMTGVVTNNATWNNSAGLFHTPLASATGDPSITTGGVEHTFSSQALTTGLQTALASDGVYLGIASPDLEAQSIRHFFVLDGSTSNSAIGPSLEVSYTTAGTNEIASVPTSDTGSTLDTALISNDYHEFTIDTSSNPAADLLTLVFDHFGSSISGHFESSIAVFASTDGFTTAQTADDALHISTVTITPQTPAYQPASTLNIPLAQSNLGGTLTVRFYFYDDSNQAGQQTGIDNLSVHGFSPNLPILDYHFASGSSAAQSHAPRALTGSNYASQVGEISESNHLALAPATETASTLAGAVADRDYQEFTVSIPDPETVLLGLKFDHLGASGGSSFNSNIAVVTSTDGFASAPNAGDVQHTSTVTVPASHTFATPLTSVDVPLSVSQFTGDFTVRLYFYDDSSSVDDRTGIDAIRLCGDAPLVTDPNIEGIVGPDYLIQINNPGFRFSLKDIHGTALPESSSHGVSFLGSAVVSSEKLSQTGNTTVYRLTNGTDDTALATIVTGEDTIEFDIALENSSKGNIAVRTGSPGASFGLADRGGWESNANLSLVQKNYPMKQNGHAHRFISSFLIFPEQRSAGVCFEKENGHINIGPNYYEMSNTSASQQKFYYYVGSMEDIYSAYRSTRIAEGYPGVSPKMDAFELGWESWDLLKWNTSATTCQNAIQGFLNRGYNIEWAVTGSGFWQSQGTTVSFGLYDSTKYPGTASPAPPDFGDWTSNQGIRWMIGQRTNFIPPGGPHSSNPGESGATLFDTSPDTQAGLNKNYFLKDSDHNVVLLTSTTFPTVDSYLLDGNAPGAAQWFENLYDQWAVNGVKEDTLMSVPDHTIFNKPMRLIAESGDLVMARCAAYSSPGSLTRINDTNGVSSLGRRMPINYLQYAASAAPNVYSDTVGFGGMSNVTSTLRHSWFLALTAGYAVSDSPWNKGWSAANETIFKKSADFHYSIGPYLHSAAVDSHATGYPYTMTPLPIAYPKDTATHSLANNSNRQFQWMIGESLMAAPITNTGASTLNVYLPKGKWIDYETGTVYHGPTTLNNFSMPLNKTPAFVGGKGILVLRDPTTQILTANIFPIASNGTNYTFTYPDGFSASSITNNNTGWNVATLVVTNTTTNTPVTFTSNTTTGAISFEITPNHSYELTAGHSN